MTVKEAKADGWRDSHEVTYENGYVARKNFDPDEAEVFVSKAGKRRGQLYYLEPCYSSNRFCYRHYLIKD